MIEPTWQSDDGRVKLWNCDCRAIGDVECGLILSDPPYGIDHPCDFKRRGRCNLSVCIDWPDVDGDNEPFDPAWMLAMNRPTILWGANYFADKLPPMSGWLVWDKERPDDLDQATCELAWTNCIKGTRRFRHLWHGMMKASERGESYHPTQKPVALFTWTLSLKWIADVQSVYDPYMGAGPCGVAAVRLGKSYMGCEKNSVHFETAKKRIQDELAQPYIPLLAPERHVPVELPL